MQRFLSIRIATVVLCLCGAACGDDDDSTNDQGKDGGSTKDASSTNDKDASAGNAKDASGKGGDESIEVFGDWDNNFGMEEVIDDMMWSGFKLIEFDNEKNLAITQNAKDDKYNPGKFNATVWTEPTADGFAYCIYTFGKDSAAAAKNEKNTADDGDLEMGCGGFGWTKLTPHEGADE